MVNTFKNTPQDGHIKADVIILGCSLPGIVIAHKLKKKFGNTMDIVVLDLAEKRDKESESKFNVAFQDEKEEDEDNINICEFTAKEVTENLARYFLTMISKDFNIPLPAAIIEPLKVRSPFYKVFEYKNGKATDCEINFHDFNYLNMFERFELNQYQTFLDQNMKDLFQSNKVDDDPQRNQLLYYDQTPMEKHICNALLFPNSRNIMRNTVRLVCGASAKTVSVLFYLHQCYRTSTCRNHLDGNNTRFREKLFGYCRQRLMSKLQNSVAEITLSSKAIEKISSNAEEQVILKTITGDTNYVCDLLAMALKPDQLHNIEVESHLLSGNEVTVISNMIKGKAKKFLVQYEENFWRREGYSGDILSIRGPIIWATERPIMSSAGSTGSYAALIGYLRIENGDDCREAVLKQLVRLFGMEAAEPISYRESDISDIYIPRCGDYIALRKLTLRPIPKYVEWGALDIYADGDIAAALEAGHTAYNHLVNSLRPQAQTYEDISLVEWPTTFNDNPLQQLLCRITITSSLRIVMYSAAAYIAARLIQSYMRR